MVLTLLSDPLFMFVTGLILYDELGISSLITLSLGRENFLTRFMINRVLSVRICNAGPSIDVA